MREATDALQKATVIVQALEYLEQNFSSAALGAHSFAGFSNFFLNVPEDMRLFLLCFTYMYSAARDSRFHRELCNRPQFAICQAHAEGLAGTNWGKVYLVH